MSTIYSRLYSPDPIQETNPKYDQSYAAQQIGPQLDNPSKKTILREINRLYKNEMSEMELSLQTMKNKYRGRGQDDHHSKSIFQKLSTFQNIERAIDEDAKSTKLQSVINRGEYYLDRPLLESNNYEEVLTEQKYMNLKIQGIRSMLAHRVKDQPTVELESYPQQQIEIDWGKLMREDGQALTDLQLFRTEVNFHQNQRNDTSTTDKYIAYTESSCNRLDFPRTVQHKQGGSGQGGQPPNPRRGKKTELSHGSLQVTSADGLATKQKIYKDIQDRIKKSTCVFGKINQSKQNDLTKQLMARLEREKEQREKVIEKITLKIK